MGVTTPSRRGSPRVRVTLELTLTRHTGRPVNAKTGDLSPGGARVAAPRTLRADELFELDLVLPDGTHVAGQARVLREQATTYALRFEQLSEEAMRRLAALVDAGMR